MVYVMVDVESDGPIPGDYSMICFGAVVVREGLEQIFYGRLKPISEKWIPEALSVSGFTREDTLGFGDPKNVMENFARWIEKNTKGRALFVSDNNGFDWQFINWYFWHFTGGTHSAIRAQILARCTRVWSRTRSRISSICGKLGTRTIRWTTREETPKPCWR